MIKNGILFFMVLLCIPCTANAAKVFLKDGGTIECFVAKQQGETVYLLINRDTEIELDKKDIAIKRTFNGKEMIGSYRRHKKYQRHR